MNSRVIIALKMSNVVHKYKSFTFRRNLRNVLKLKNLVGFSKKSVLKSITSKLVWNLLNYHLLSWRIYGFSFYFWFFYGLGTVAALDSNTNYGWVGDWEIILRLLVRPRPTGFSKYGYCDQASKSGASIASFI